MWRMYRTAAVMVAALNYLLQPEYVAGIDLFNYFQESMVAGNCDPSFGPSGTVQCVSLTGYTGKQWASCLTDTYIQQKSRGHHHCEDRKVTYCYYQCMLEVHDLEVGDVTSDCSCDSVGPSMSPVTWQPLTTLDPLCYSPTGDRCSWYRNCLRRKIPCSGGTDGYAIDYAETFCNRFDEFRYQLSQQGQHWMEATRKCLQVSLVPSLRPFATQTCVALKQLAFDSHPSCYLKPYERAPSFCDLSINDMLQIFWIVKGAFVTDPIESILGLYQVMKQCMTVKATSVLAEGKTVLLKANLQVNNIMSLGRSKRSAAALSVDTDIKLSSVSMQSRYRRQIPNTIRVGVTEEGLLYHRLAGELSSVIASRLQWTNKDLIWFPYGQRGENSSIVETYILLTDKRSYGLQNPWDSGLATNMTSLLYSTAKAFQGGTLNGITLQGQRVQLMTLSSCLDDDCQRVAFTVVAPPEIYTEAPPPAYIALTPRSKTSGSDVTSLCFTAFIALLLLAFHLTKN